LNRALRWDTAALHVTIQRTTALPSTFSRVNAL